MYPQHRNIPHQHPEHHREHLGGEDLPPRLIGLPEQHEVLAEVGESVAADKEFPVEGRVGFWCLGE